MAIFSISGFNPSFSGSGTYQEAANLNKELFNAQQQTWAQRLAQFQAGMQGVTSGWSNLTNRAMGLLRGTNRANLQDIADKYTALSGQMSNQMIDRGLGNTTVQQAMQIGLRASQQKEATRSRGVFGQLLADTLGRLGGSGLAAQERGVTGASDIMGGYAGFLNSISAPYPRGGSEYGAYGGGGGGAPTVVGGGRPIGGFQPQYPGAGMIDFSGGGGGPVDPSFYGNASPGFGQMAANQYSALPGYEQGASAYGPYVPPGSYPQTEATYG